MIITPLKPRKALNKAFLKVKPNRADIESFKTNLITLLDRTNDTESEEFHKNLVSDFLKDTYYKQNHFINTKGRNDLVIHNGQNAKSTVGVIIEAKKPTNKAEMISLGNINKKAFQELVLYYLRERITNKNLEVKHLVATNIKEWFIFDVSTFERLFAQNRNFVNQFNDFEAGRLADTKTDFFYKHIAEPFIAQLLSPLPLGGAGGGSSGGVGGGLEFTHFNIQDYQNPLRNANKADDNTLIALFKLLSPEHLLKLPFTNDSNSLDKRFYSELLHIIGLTETKDGGKKLIQRNKEGERNTGSILEDAIIQIDSTDKIYRLDKPAQYGNTQQERLFNVALELSITWINRILFLKLLEAQLISYHKAAKATGNSLADDYKFLNSNIIKSYDDLNSLFFQVLARKHDERNEDVKKAFEKVPYLNSSLFESTELEHVIFNISNLKDDKTLPIFSQTVLKDQSGRKKTGNLNTLQYLFEFLNAYDFSSEGSEEIQEDNKTLINASVLGLIFEKINGYKDGSFFTPGFITMYMCRETIRKAVVQKFQEHAQQQELQNGEISKIEDIYELIPQKISRKKANEIVNSLKICDPAVGSGHFLVSALNEMIAIKNDLKILEDKHGKSLHRYEVEVVNDELTVTDEEGQLYEYNPNNKESQRIQETLFHEKQTIIENCLFGVDINSNSVKICRLRLWIELLKNAYYMVDSAPVSPPHVQTLHATSLPYHRPELQTLPNIDINIKTGNSLVNRFAIDADLKQALKKSRWTIDTYKVAVSTYRNAESKEQKREMERLIADIKSDFRSEIESPFKKKIADARGKVENLSVKILNLKTFGEKIDKQLLSEHQKASDALTKIETERDEIKANKIFENAFEWRFEFPEVLNNDGDFIGFDVVIGNPPYFIMTKNNMETAELRHYIDNYKVIKNATSKNIFNLFIELGIAISKSESIHSMIVPEGLFETRSYSDTIEMLKKEGTVANITRIEGMVFDEANTGNVIYIFDKGKFGAITEERFFDKNQDLIRFNKIEDPLILKMDTSKYPRLSDVCQLFKGMVVADRKTKIFEERTEELPNKFLLGNCISKWKIEKAFYTNYQDLKIIGGTKSKEKHAVAPRILIRRTGTFLCCAYLTEPALTESTLYSCWSINKEISNLFILGVLHSKVADYYIKSKLITNPQAFPQILMTDLQSIPIPSPTTELHNEIMKITEARLSESTNTTALENQIDQLVYQLYELTEEEIKIVEGNG